MRLTKKKKLDINHTLEMSCGTTNRLNPQIIFVEGKFWLEPKTEMEYEKILSPLVSKLRKDLKNSIRYKQNEWDNKLIFDVDIKYNSLVPNKKSFVDFEIYFKQNNDNVKDVLEISDDITALLKPLFDDFVGELIENDFIMSKTKA